MGIAGELLILVSPKVGGLGGANYSRLEWINRYRYTVV
jgi:hypothetical protein